MTLDEVREYFGSDQKACQALNLNRQNFTLWRRRGYIPLVKQFEIEELTTGVLKASLKHIKKTEEKND